MAEHHTPARRVCPGARSICGLARPPGADRPAAVMDAVLRGALWRGTPQQRRWHCGPGCGGRTGASSWDLSARRSPAHPAAALRQGGGDRCVQQRVRAQPVCLRPEPGLSSRALRNLAAGRVPAEANAALGAVAGGSGTGSGPSAAPTSWWTITGRSGRDATSAGPAGGVQTWPLLHRAESEWTSDRAEACQRQVVFDVEHSLSGTDERRQ